MTSTTAAGQQVPEQSSKGDQRPATSKPEAPHHCATPDCSKPANLRCPTCVELEISDIANTYFCSQTCFRASWSKHKKIHAPRVNVRALDLSAKRRRAAFANYNYTGALRVGYVHLPMRKVPPHIVAPDYAQDGIPRSEEKFNRSSLSFRVLDEKGISGMRTVCRLAREVLDIAVRAAGVGVSTEHIDQIVHQACIDRDSYPSPLNYYGYPKSCCTSVNEVICHGIPDDRPLRDGDILNIDITLYHGGYHGDVNETICIGECSQKNRQLIRTAHDALWTAIRRVKPGTLIREFGAHTEKMARSRNCSVVRSYCGHGINEEFHTAPNVPHYKRNKAVGTCRTGMTFTIEPMLNSGSWQDELWPDDWTAVTSDGSCSAQFEHTLLVTPDGCEVLTRRLEDGPAFWWEQSDSPEHPSV